MPYFLGLICNLLLILILAENALAAGKPNILLMMADDLGFSDLGCYGSEIDTPNLDRLAKQGVRFTQFYNTAKCHSSRVSLLSGRWCRQAGDESLKNAYIIPEVLKPAGYFTAMTGKWHLSKQPTDFGFDRYLGHLSGATNYYLGDNTFRLNGEKFDVPNKGFYTTVANVDYGLKFINEARDKQQPWFLYIAFNAPHAPLQPLEEDYKKYLGKYDVGWDVIREQRVTKQKRIGLLPEEMGIPSRPEHIQAWNEMESERKSWEAKRMAAYAALIHRMDTEVGRLVQDLETRQELENTLIVFVSDNGACPYDRGQPQPDKNPYDPNVRWSDSTGWAWARNSPFRYYKQNQFEGGISSPCIIHWPFGITAKTGSICAEPANLVDILPTFAEITQAKLPDSYPDRTLTPLQGISLVPALKGQEIKYRPPIHLLFNSDRGLRDGDWKLVSFQSHPWELYNIKNDRTEMHNLADKEPERLNQMIAMWEGMTKNLLHAPLKEYAPVNKEESPQIHREWTDFSQDFMHRAPRNNRINESPAD